MRIIPFSRTSHIVYWLTPAYGLLRTVVKGACRPKSWFLGQYDLFQNCEIVVYARSRNGLHILKECSTTLSRTFFRSDWRAAGVASYLCELATRHLHGHILLPECFDLLSGTLDALATSRARLALTFWYELRFLHALGLAPSLLRCSSCNTSIAPQQAYTFSITQGGLLCPRCPVREIGRDPFRLSPDLVAILRRWQQTESPDAAVRFGCSARQFLAISALLDSFIACHLDIKLRGRQIAIELSNLENPSDIAADRNHESQAPSKA